MDTANEPRFPLLALSRLRMGCDGKGVTTLVAGAGCPLSCRYCLNRAVLADPHPRFVSARELLDRVSIDDLYFRATGGGVTFGGGESLLHASFILRFRDVCPDGWQINAETSLAVPWPQVELAAEAVGTFIVDCKDLDADRYRRYTGGDAALMKDNLLRLLDRIGPDRIHIRVPLIPDYNTADDQAEIVEQLRDAGFTRLEAFTYLTEF